MADTPKTAENKILVGILGILLGGLGVHKFVLGYTTEGLIMLAVTLGGFALAFCTFGLTAFASSAMGIIGLVEGIIYLTKSDEEFVQTYVANKRPWF
ncbi:MAG: NINE protein [Planctomycetota bacterium]